MAVSSPSARSTLIQPGSTVAGDHRHRTRKSCLLGNNDGSALGMLQAVQRPIPTTGVTISTETIDNDEAQVYNLAPGVHQVTVTDANDYGSLLPPTTINRVPPDISLIADIDNCLPGRRCAGASCYSSAGQPIHRICLDGLAAATLG